MFSEKKASYFAKSEHTERSICWVFTTTLKAWVRPSLDCKQGTMSLPFLQNGPLTHPTLNEPMVEKIQAMQSLASQNRARIQLSTSSLTIHGGAIFSAVSGRKSIPISAIEAPEHGAWYRLLGFCLTITFCLIPAHQAVSYWNCHWYWRISRLGDHKYLPFVTNPYEIKQANPLTNTAISKGNGLVCWN